MYVATYVRPFTLLATNTYSHSRAVDVQCWWVGPAGTHIVLPRGGLQHGGEEASGESEPRGPVQGGGRARTSPLADLLHSCYEVPSPSSKGLHGGIGLQHRTVEAGRQ